MIQVQEEAILDAAEARLDRWAKADLDELRKDPTLSVKTGLRDPVRPFVKGEMHPSRKVDTPRLIMAISIVDQLVERYIFSDFSTNEKRQYPNYSNMVGFGRSLAHDRSITQKVRGISHMTGTGPTASDVSGWERRVSPEDLEGVAHVIHGAREEPDEEWLHYALVWAVVSARPCYVIGDKLYISYNFGMMPSGTFMTSFGNGIMRIVYALAAGAKDVVVLGDDCLEWHDDPQSVVKTYNDWGLVTRDVISYPSDGKSFCFCSKFYDSTNEDEPLVIPQSYQKMVASFANQKNRLPSHLVSLKDELKGLPGPLYTQIIEWATGLRYVLPPGVEQEDGAEKGPQATAEESPIYRWQQQG